ncbi:glycosyltransferase family 32 protein [Cantharellus anzutake]|uniref:glycosyltransferase family 32 protein n=1 Tax=Cantharellus anzutake TaxID=1750568 RepID=UPI0019067104|nr:glycosyltransferase family 32 protein [Cantharellus anzutake]KAF8324842.1 glycosyltransferase family 32 protein [Cantharellus anzutake]
MMLRSNTRGPSLPAYRSDGELTKSPRSRKRLLGLWLFRLRPLIKYPLLVIILALLWFFYRWELHFEISLISRPWIRQGVTKIEPLLGCFSPERLNADGNQYNFTLARAPKTYDVQSGLQLRHNMDCYNLAGTIPSPLPSPHGSPSLPRSERTNYHTYWPSDLLPFDERHEWTLKSFFATQNIRESTLIIWTDDASVLMTRPRIAIFLAAYPEAFEVRTVEVDTLAHRTPLHGSPLLKSSDQKTWIGSDLLRLLVLWAHGGIWIDMDSLLTRDLNPLLEHEFVTQWDCYDNKYQPTNGALMHFHKHSPYLCEAFHIMHTCSPPKPGSTDWGSYLYSKLWRRLVAASIPPFKILPFCFSDGCSCRMDNRLPDPFAPDGRTWGNGLSLKEGGDLDKTLRKVFAVHLHNQWEKPFPADGWVERLLLRRYTGALRERN